MTQVDQGWIKTTCAYCGVGCGVEARACTSGKIEVRGDKSHPANFGKLCTKGIALGETLIDDGRLLQPQKRVSRSENTRQDISWEQATDEVAQTFLEVISTHGPDAVAFYVSGQLLTEDYYLANKLMKGFIGSGNIDSNSRLCMASSVVGHKRAFGQDTVPICYQDIEEAELVLLIGSNLAWCHPVLFQRLRLAKQTNPDLEVVVIDPRRTASCDIADTHLSLKSGTDIALFNGLLAYLAIHDGLDQDFMTAHTQDGQACVDAAKLEMGATEADILSKVGQVCELDVAQVLAFYQSFLATQKVLSIYSQGVNQSAQGSDKVNSILNCHLATGKIGQTGCGPFSVTGQPNAMGGREVGALANTLAAHFEFDNRTHHQAVADFWQAPQLAATPGLKAVDMFDAMLEGKIKAVWIMATNPVVSLPDSAKVKAALETCPFVVVSDCIQDTATSQFADIRLPAQAWAEKSGTVTNSERRISRQRKIVASPGVAKPDWWIISQVAKKMGFEKAFKYLHQGQIFREYAAMTSIEIEGERRDLNLKGLADISDKTYQEMTPQQWPVMAYQDEIVHQRFFAKGGFYTPNQKARFVPVQQQAIASVEQAEGTNKALCLNTGRSRDHWHTMTRTGLAPNLSFYQAEPYVLIHPQTAQARNIADGDLVKVTRQSLAQKDVFSKLDESLMDEAHCVARVIYDEGMQEKQIYMPIHWNAQSASKAEVCALIDQTRDPHSGQPEFKHSWVDILPVKLQCTAFILAQTSQVAQLQAMQIAYWSGQKLTHGYQYIVQADMDKAALMAQLKNKIEDDCILIMQDLDQDLGLERFKLFDFSRDETENLFQMCTKKGHLVTQI